MAATVSTIGMSNKSNNMAPQSVVGNSGERADDSQRNPNKSTDTPPGSTGLDDFGGKSPEIDKIVIDRASRVTVCILTRERVGLGESGTCPNPDIFGHPGVRPAEDFSSSMPSVSANVSEQSTSV